MKNLHFFITIIMIAACNQNQTTTNSTYNNGNTEPIYYEQKLIVQFKDYLNSMLIGDIDKTIEYMHPIGIERLKNKYPEEKDINSIKNKFKERFISSGTEETNRKLNMKFIPGNVLDFVEYKDEFIYVLNYTKEGGNDLDHVNIRSAAIGISTEKGTQWKFIELDIDAIDKYKKLLSNYYPNDIVDQVFNDISKKEGKNIDKVIPLANSKAEKNLFIQFNEYFNAYLTGDYKKAMSYIYPTIFEYIIREDPTLNLDEAKNMFKEKALEAVSKKYKNLSVKINIQKILSKIQSENDLLYVLSYSLDSEKESENLSFGGELIAISDDNGSNWKFFENDKEMTKSVLSINYPTTTINALLNY